jgi:type II secretory pathway component PulF
MALFSYSAVDDQGAERKGTIDATGIDMAIVALQRRGLIVSNIEPVESEHSQGFNFFQRVTTADVVMLSRQMTTLFEAQVSALRAFRLLASEARTPLLGEKLSAVAADIQNGSAISAALSKHPDVFSAIILTVIMK